MILITKKLGWPIFLDTSQPLSPATLSSPSGLMNKVAMVARVEVMHGFTNMDFYSPSPTWLWPPLSAQSSSSRDQHRVLNMTLFLGVISQLRVGRLIIWDHFHPGRGSILLLLGYTFTVNMNLPSLHATQNYHPWTYRMSIYCYGIPHSISSNQGTHFTAKEV